MLSLEDCIALSGLTEEEVLRRRVSTLIRLGGIAALVGGTLALRAAGSAYP